MLTSAGEAGACSNHCRGGHGPYLLVEEASSKGRELFRVGQDAAVLTGNLSPLVAAGLFYLAITVPLTHLVNYFDNRFRTGRRRPVAPSSGLKEVKELDAASPLITGSNT